MRLYGKDLDERIEINPMGEVCEVVMKQNSFRTKANFEHGIQAAIEAANSGKYKSVLLVFEKGQITVGKGQKFDQIRAQLFHKLKIITWQ